ncbi:MAG: urease accessory protein UreF [Lamprobacter sp.]|uniref:urease accessory protein UreF n=1 Tax=Lamprobacter sp. TaxID=3100796 RepID=UPI002B25B20C|nr:urease accessory protein UreF [Lamprobacter sp.]MEA3639699.1 urease accessory protein UreF [Lamprobacter sp.]
MNDAARLLRALQFGDSVFPVGGFAFSAGLETAIAERVVTDAESLSAYTRTALELAMRGDGVGLIWAYRAAQADDLRQLTQIDAQVYARKLSSETRTMSVRMGKKFTELSAQILHAALLQRWLEQITSGATPGCYPVALGINFAVQGLSARDAFAVHQYGVAAMILSAALRLMRIGHVETQQMLFALSAGADADYETAAAMPLADMAGFAPMTEILAAAHVKATVRLFMS